jgi:NADH:ubiquinone oxidoreductase subunit 2 (subunit N)
MLFLLLLKGKCLVYIDVFNQFSKSVKLRTFLVFSMFNLAGTPPTPLFLIKAANIYYSALVSINLITYLVVLLSVVSILFYVQLVRFLYRNSSKFMILTSDHLPFVSSKLVSSLMVLSLLVFLLLGSSYDALVIFNKVNPA